MKFISGETLEIPEEAEPKNNQINQKDPDTLIKEIVITKEPTLTEFSPVWGNIPKFYTAIYTTPFLLNISKKKKTLRIRVIIRVKIISHFIKYFIDIPHQYFSWLIETKIL